MNSYETCEHCGAPLDPQQRYCVQCANRRRGAGSPTDRYFALTARRRRRPAGGQTRASRGGSGSRAAAVAFFALLPIAVAVGVLVGQGHSGNNDQALADALKNLKGGAVASAGTGTNVFNTGSSQPLPSDFKLAKGYTVKLDLLPVKSTDKAAAKTAESDASSKGAKDVGIINPSDFTITPDQGTSNYILFSGQFKTKGEAAKALKGKFSSAEVLSLTSASAGGGKVVAKTKFGTLHQVAGFKPSAAKIKSDAQVVQGIANNTGQSYVQQQKTLPDVVVVSGGGSNGGNGGATGAGD